jgi:hypothetical protein
MAGLRFTALQSRPMEFLDFTSLRPCPSSVRVDTRGLPADFHKGKKAWKRELSWHHSGSLPPGDALEAGCANARCLLRRPPFAVPHHHGVLTAPLAGATAARETAASRMVKKSVPPHNKRPLRKNASSSRRQSSGGCQPAATHSRLTMTAMT